MKRALDRVLAGTLLILAFLAARPALAIDFFDLASASR